MNPQEPPQEDSEREESAAEPADRDHSVASKLSEELSNWRRRRHTGGGRHKPVEERGGGGSFQSQSARTIKVRGHETLVIRKPKSASLRRTTPDSTER